LTQGLADFKSGKLTAHYKSAPVPETNDQPVKVVVGDSFESLVTTDDKYVLLEAYAPWCGHCKKLEPIYNELAEKLAAEADVVIAKMDATENEHPLMPVQGFPTLRLFKPGSTTPVDYNGDRSLKDIVKFLEDNVGRTFSELKSSDL
jgi:protein disulfide-isomerase A1